MSTRDRILALLSVPGTALDAAGITSIMNAKRSTVDAALARMRVAGEIQWDERPSKFGEDEDRYRYRLYYLQES